MVERSEVDQMAKFMAAMNDTPSDTPGGAASPSTGKADDSAVAEMKLILERFHAAADQIVTEAPYDHDLREALATETTDRGVRIGAWEIQPHPAGKHKLYDVVNAVNGAPLAIDLLLYEAARGLVRMLNDGGRINSKEVIDLLRAEQEYGSLVNDMVHYKRRLTENASSARILVFEARYSDAKRRATQARERIGRLTGGSTFHR
jgi:hypothetical protein